MTRRWFVTVIMGLTLVWVHPSVAVLGIGDTAIVFDPNNYFANIATQINTLKSTVNEATQITNQIKALEYQLQSLWNEAQNLKANPLQLLGRIQGMWDAYNTIMRQAEGTAFALTQTSARFETSYPTLASGNTQEVTSRLSSMLQSIRAGAQTAVQTQSIYERLCNELDANTQALTAAQASVGALQIAQAQAQIQALTNEQLATLTQIEAASSRVETEWIAMQVKERQDATAINRQFVGGLDQGFKGIGQSKGVTLK
jgi:P-type conjugative transfer protein TrbJ